MGEADLAAVVRIADTVHPDYPESAAVFAERLALFGAGCLIAVSGEGTPVGYAIMHPTVIGSPPGLDTLLGRIDGDADCMHLHDVALLPEARRSGLGTAALRHAHVAAAAAGLSTLALIATPQARAYWVRHGFTTVDGGPLLAAKLAGYGAGLVYMTRPAAPI